MGLARSRSRSELRNSDYLSYRGIVDKLIFIYSDPFPSGPDAGGDGTGSMTSTMSIST
jgi:hypothetical protein